MYTMPFLDTYSMSFLHLYMVLPPHVHNTSFLILCTMMPFLDLYSMSFLRLYTMLPPHLHNTPFLHLYIMPFLQLYLCFSYM